MTAREARISIGDDGVLNEALPDDLSNIWRDRDLGSLDFNDRVLAQALDERTPLLERAKFLAIFSSNIDEFFMKRIPVLREKLTPERLELLKLLRGKLLPMLRCQAGCFRNSIVPELVKHGIVLARWEDLTSEQQGRASRYFDEQVCPALTPLVIDAGHAFPFLSNLSTSLVFSLRDPSRGETRYARVKVPGVLKQWIPVEPADHPLRVLIPLHDVIRANLHKLYRGMELGPVTLFRLTRDAEVTLDDESEDAPIAKLVQEQIRQRRYEPVVRLEFAIGSDPAIKKQLCLRFELQDLDVYDLTEEVDYTSLFEIAAIDVPALRDSPWIPVHTQAFSGPEDDRFADIREADILVHHPYECFADSVERFVSDAADDPQTLAIKMTAYRIGDDTPFVKSLIRAAEAGKQIACVMEIQARFDEERNLQWAAELEEVGAHVSYGVRGLKTHAKTILVVRKEGGELRSYVHIGTGNYHVRTARLYADVGLFTCNPAITQDVIQFFHFLTGRSLPPDYRTLLVAPERMRRRFLDLVDREIENHKAGRPARLVCKMNQLEDPEMIRKLMEASLAGVQVELIVRGFCCLLPGIVGRTENITIRSIIGRFLEHSRIFYFAAGKSDPLEGEFYIGSADWMHRNLSGRIEVVTPILSQDAKVRLWEVLDICLRDQRQAWVMNSDGSYTQLQPDATAGEVETQGTHQTLDVNALSWRMAEASARPSWPVLPRTSAALCKG